MSVGMPQTILLESFGRYIRDAFGDIPYHVGSSLHNKTGWRDVDIRLIMPDDEYKRQGFGDPRCTVHNAKWSAICLAWSIFGKELTGLPIDFQIQQQSYANEKFKDNRSALGLLIIGTQIK